MVVVDACESEGIIHKHLGVMTHHASCCYIYIIYI